MKRIFSFTERERKRKRKRNRKREERKKERNRVEGCVNNISLFFCKETDRHARELSAQLKR